MKEELSEDTDLRRKSFADGRDRNIVVWNGLQWM